VRGFFEDVFRGEAEGYTCEANVAELYYKTCEKLGREAAEIRSASLRDSVSVLPLDERLTRAAGALKCKYGGRVSLVDAYTLAAAKILGGILVTTDSRLAELKVVQVKLVHPS